MEMYPPLEKDHKVLGKDYCPGFTDSFGKWNTGFYCPVVFCCGATNHKYCCSGQTNSKPVEMETEIEITTDYDTSSTTSVEPETDIERNSYVAAVICGIVAVTVLMTIVSCFYCSCCLLYKKRRAQLAGGLYRIPASSTTCGLINSANGFTTPGSSSFVTTPLNPTAFSSDCWANPPSGQLHHTTNPQLPQPPSNISAHVNPILNGEHRISSSSNNTTTNPTTNANTNSTLRIHQPSSSTIAVNNSTSTLPIIRLQRQLSLFQHQDQNPSRPTTTTNNNNNNTNHNNNNQQSYSSRNVATIYNTGRSNTTGTMSSLISSVSSNSTSSLPPPYFLEQYRIRNRVRQPRNPPQSILLPSYNEIQRQQQQQQQSASSGHGRRQPRNPPPQHPPPLPPTTTSTSPAMNDLSAPPRRNRERNHRPLALGLEQIIQSNNFPPTMSPTSRLEESSHPLPRDNKILNTSVQIQSTTSNDATATKRVRAEDNLQSNKKATSISNSSSRNRIKSHSLENISAAPSPAPTTKSDTPNFSHTEISLRI